ncbi:lysine-specific demethylase JMJ705 [Dendrobium catenatum]|uniref:Lysine-specific demethylase REF6 n=1 Tax=Dendrobium catenatum TaxID=906689 RepID=A0A2I0VMQ9_9ASPA|nr:lysine-specific demethylase JMJ705 [Dendrobium catenatum]PKU64687.1 Lysine-specific demethylase REF6 [Dendrobium catenatum]
MAPDPSLSEVLPWLKTLPLAPEYRPTLVEFQDPIAYILKIEQEASRYGICKIVPPVPAAPKTTAVANLNLSFSSRSPSGDPTFTTRQQQIGFCPRRPRPVQKSVWQSGCRYTLSQFETKARSFERAHLRKSRKKNRSSTSLCPIEVESLFWKTAADKPSSVEYANDMPGSGFAELREGEMDMTAAENVGETAWNMRGVARAKGSLLRFMREEIPGVTSPMVYVAMLFSWFAWHVEDHDLHSLNYLHMGAGKTWYGVPRDAALAFEEVVRIHGYGGEVNPLITFATLAEKTTLMSPEVLISSGIPCCRLVQNAGEFVVTFPGSYHSGFSHGFNCGEASNIATPEWLKVAKEAAIRRASTNCPPMVSHYQLLYALALSLCSRNPKIVSTPKSSRLKHKRRCVGETMIKETFVQNVIHNNSLLNILLDDGSSCLILPQRTFDKPLCSGLHLKLQMKVKPRIALGLCHAEDKMEGNSVHDFYIGSRSSWPSSSGFCPAEENSNSVYYRKNLLATKISSLGSSGSQILSSRLQNKEGQNNKYRTDGVLDQGLLSCVTCGILSYACVAVMQPSEAAAEYLLSSNCNSFSNQIVGFEENCGLNNEATSNTLNSDVDVNVGHIEKIHSPVQVHFRNDGLLSNAKVERGASALDLLAAAYGDLSDSEEDALHDVSFCADGDKLTHSSLMCIVDDQSASDKDSYRMHVFCLEHAVEVEKRLRVLGGVNMMLLCHPEYPKIESEAKLVAEELGLDHQWKSVKYRDASEQDQEKIRLAIEDEDVIPCNGDWAVKLGINLYYSVSLSQSPLFRKQLPYNEVIYKSFFQKSPVEQISSGTISRRQKKIIFAGKWCGKVWMSNQVHPFLADQNFPDDDDNIDVSLEANSYRENVNQLVLSRRNSLNSYTADRRNSGKKRTKSEYLSSARKHAPAPARLDKDCNARYAEENSGYAGNADCDPNTDRSEAETDIEEDDEQAILGRRNSTNNNAVARRKSDHKKYTVRSSTRKCTHTWLDKSSDARCAEENSGNADGEQDRDRSEADTDMEDDKQANGSRWNSTKNNAYARRKFYKRKKSAVISNALKHAHIKSDNFSDSRYAKENSAHAGNSACAPDADRSQSNSDIDDDIQATIRKRHLTNSNGAPKRKSDEKRKCSVVRSRTRKATHTQLEDSSNAGCAEENTGNARYADDDRHRDQSSEADTDSEGKKQASVPRKNLPNNNAAARKKSGKKRKKLKDGCNRKAAQTRSGSSAKTGCAEDNFSMKCGGRFSCVSPSVKGTNQDQRSMQLRKRRLNSGEANVIVAPEKPNNRKKIKKALDSVPDKENFSCDIEGCCMSFRTKHDLCLHKRNVCPEKGCGKKFFSHKYLLQHRKVHCDDRPLKCPWKGCKMTFKWAWARTEHIRVHTGERPYSCREPGCDLTFRFVSDFSRHRRKTGH